MNKNKILKKNSLTDRHTRSSQEVLLVVLRKKNIPEEKKISALASIRKKTIAPAD